MEDLNFKMAASDLSTQAQPVGEVLPRACYDEVFLRQRLLYGPCMLAVFSKMLGYVLIGTITIGQIPQIVKLLRKRSASGVSFVSMLLMLEASTATVAYAIQTGYPLSTWGENLVLMHQNVILVCLLLRYNDKLKASLSFLVVYIGVVLFLLWPSVPSQLVWYLYLFSMPAVSVSRMIQMYKIYRNKDPGQLSAVSTFLLIFQSFGRLTTSILITGDAIMICTFVIVSVLNCSLLVQVLYYRRKIKKVK